MKMVTVILPPPSPHPFQTMREAQRPININSLLGEPVFVRVTVVLSTIFMYSSTYTSNIHTGTRQYCYGGVDRSSA